MLTKKKERYEGLKLKKIPLWVNKYGVKTMQDWRKQVCTLEIGEGQRVLAMKDREQF